MNTSLTAFDSHHLAGESAIYAQADRPSGAHSLAFMSFLGTSGRAPQGDSDPLRAKARVESYAPAFVPARGRPWL